MIGIDKNEKYSQRADIDIFASAAEPYSIIPEIGNVDA